MRLLVLGSVVRKQPAHGYRILSDIQKWRVETWTDVKPGSIYHAITQLEKQGLLEPAKSTSKKKLGPTKTEYAITKSGRTEFLDLLRKALSSFSIDQFSTGIVFMEFLPRSEVIALLTKRATELRQVPKFLKTLPTEPIPSEPSKHPELMNVWVTYMNDMATATDEIIYRVKSGAYKFKGE